MRQNIISVIGRDGKEERYRRVCKKSARRIHETESILVTACKTNVNSPWAHFSELKVDEDFDMFVDEFSYYNCNTERGKYPAFYVSMN